MALQKKQSFSAKKGGPVKVNVIGIKSLRKKLDSIPDDYKLKLQSIISRNADNIQAEARRLIREPPKTGIKHPSLPNQSSAPGEAPANQTGKLMRGIVKQKFKSRGIEFVRVVSNAAYSAWLEFGTRNMLARPFLQPAFKRWKKNVRLRIKREIKGKIK